MMPPWLHNWALVAALALGWTLKGWQVDSWELVAAKAAQASTEAAREYEGAQAAILEKVLTGLRANERTIIRETKTVVENPVYRNICLDARGVRLANDAKNGVRSGEPLYPVP